jgi:hypothetical protein
MDVAARWAAAWQLFCLFYYRARPLELPWSALKEDPEPRPTNAWALKGITFSMPISLVTQW